MSQKVWLIILDGRGLAEDTSRSAIAQAHTPNFDHFWDTYSHTTLVTYGEQVGLPKWQMWNSEVWHMNIGAWRVIYQDLVKIGKSMREWEFEHNEILIAAVDKAKSENKPIHLVWLVSDGGVHSHIDHLLYLIDICHKQGVRTIVHAITDGRDVGPQTWLWYIHTVHEFCKLHNSHIQSVVGRYYAMDRDNRWERVAKAYDLFVKGVGTYTNDLIASMQAKYNQWITDEFMTPMIYTPDFVQNNFDAESIESSRTSIKLITLEYLEDVYEWASEKISEYLVINIKSTIEDTKNFLEKSIKQQNSRTDYVFVVRDKQTNEFIGLWSIHKIQTKNLTYGIWVKESKQWQWYGFEFSKAIIDRTFEHIRSDSFIKYEWFADNAWIVALAEKLWWVLIAQQLSKNWKHDSLKLNIYHIYSVWCTKCSDNFIQDWSIVIITNFRTDRGRELVAALNQSDHDEYNMKALDLTMITMTNYDDSFHDVQVLAPRQNLTMTLGEVLSLAGKTQLRIAETEKYPHVTFFFSWGQEREFEGEHRIVVPSPKVATYDLQPEMSAALVTQSAIDYIISHQPDFIALNWANTDMVWHTWIMSAAIKAAEVVDTSLGQLVYATLPLWYMRIVIADHGNADIIMNLDWSAHTAHTLNPVPCIIISQEPVNIKLSEGKLADVAPTILKLIWVNQPSVMDGVSLI